MLVVLIFIFSNLNLGGSNSFIRVDRFPVTSAPRAAQSGFASHSFWNATQGYWLRAPKVKSPARHRDVPYRNVLRLLLI